MSSSAAIFDWSKVRSVFGFGGLRRLGGLGLRLRRRLLLFLLQGFRDRIDLGLFRLLLDRLRLFLRLALGHGLRRIGLLLDRLFLDLRLRRRRGVGHDRRLLGDLADGVFDGLGLGDLLHQRLRIFLLAGLHAGDDLGELVGGDDIDGQGFFRHRLRTPWSKTTPVPTRSRGRAGQSTPASVLSTLTFTRLGSLLHFGRPAPAA